MGLLEADSEMESASKILVRSIFRRYTCKGAREAGLPASVVASESQLIVWGAL